MDAHVTVQLDRVVRHVGAGRDLAAAARSARRATEEDAARNALQEGAALTAARQQLEAEREQLRQTLQALTDGLEQLSRLRQEALQAAEEQLVGLAIQIAEKVLMQQIDAQRYQIDPIVRELLGQVPSRGRVVVRLNPADHAACGLAGGQGSGDGDGSVAFVADAGVARAACVVDCADGVIEFSAQSQLGAVAASLEGTE